ncbi:glutathione S-transferase [Pokkaliibacter sp. MBI-7]|uniref:glutathione S-transferase family protein n=1 Tax=Pokkaliibacter sp. MBI-7 TaxID=3040600 RepID=UPI00244B3C00|nr:glutathione S-transferase [Pokkaliibacter sp. MBI-7]MDH2434658.1 glutathione S-transferase [Pokkaliibacter sp. MBI-7]
MIELYELCGANPAHLFSPFCWRVRMALLHKGLAFSSQPVCFTDKEQIAFSGQGKVPVIRDGDTVVYDSMAIFAYLDRTYPDKPLLGEGVAAARARAIDALCTSVLRGGLLKMLLLRVLNAIHDKDHEYFRSTREAFFSNTLENVDNPEQGKALLDSAWPVLAAVLKEQPYFDGDTPAGADYLVFGHFMWAYTLGIAPWQDNAPVNDWFNRLLNSYEAQQGAVVRTA